MLFPPKKLQAHHVRLGESFVVFGLQYRQRRMDEKSKMEELIKLSYYHGHLSREMVNRMLNNNGDFLLRKRLTQAKTDSFLVLSVRHNDKVSHSPIMGEDKVRCRWWWGERGIREGAGGGS